MYFQYNIKLQRKICQICTYIAPYIILIFKNHYGHAHVFSNYKVYYIATQDAYNYIHTNLHKNFCSDIAKLCSFMCKC